ncbi:MFS transporter [Candidatus Symbiopectobacterium sp. 'North America']|uniref:MFS transporter n=1 Tax=Candidatus Symbiopectobacterium sp. 'North America' TaxID=2794574 RepID=UPI0018CA9A27|nr:MFS transporter [Candidatus Symbiopectobacterium sp. 'North America']MBG6244744.1 MFS transporter [Candidatus Symbiopectobacterium sp. 'North America']
MSTLVNTDAASKKIGKKRWFVVFLLLIGGIINYLDRAALSIAALDMMKDLHLTNNDIGLMGSVFALIYAMCQLPSGWLVDKFGPKKVYSWAIGLWSGATMLTGACSNLTTLLFARGILGITEAPCWPGAAKITASWFPKKERALATGFWDAASKWGPAIAPPILVAIIVPFGWRALFFIAGGIDLIFLVFFLFAYHQSEKHPTLSKEELDYIKEGGGGTAEKLGNSEVTISWGGLFKYKCVWGMILGWFCYVWMMNIFTTFLPLYLMKTQNIELKALGIHASIPYFGGIVGAIGGGYLSKWLMEKEIFSDLLVAKRVTISVSALLAGVAVVAIPFAISLTGTLALLVIAMALLSALSATGWALPGDVAPASMVASVGSVQNFGGYFAGSLSPLVIGMIADATGSYTMAFVSGRIIAGCAASCYWFIVRKPIVANA